MRLQLLLRLADDPVSSVWRRVVERAYAGVPRVGDWVYLDDATEPRQVVRVTWRSDGSVDLGFGTIVADPDFGERLLAFGFAREP